MRSITGATATARAHVQTAANARRTTERFSPAVIHAAIAVLIGLLAIATPVSASSYVGRGDTGFYGFARKSQCCDIAKWLAKLDGERACRRTGGFAHESRRPTTGRCEWDSRQTNSNKTLYRCRATTSTRCRR